jgi:hypothetical protein
MLFHQNEGEMERKLLKLVSNGQNFEFLVLFLDAKIVLKKMVLYLLHGEICLTKLKF